MPYGVDYGEQDKRIAIAIIDEYLARGVTDSALATVENQALQIAIETAIRDRLPAALIDGKLSVTGSPETQAISALVLPLPNGAGTSANQASQITLETAIRDRLPVALIDGRLVVDASGVTQPISASALPLPVGASTEATLLAVRNALQLRTARTDRGGTTHATAGTWKQVMAANTGRSFWRIHNPLTNTANIEIGLGVTGTFAISSLAPGATDEESLPYSISPDAIMIRSSFASVGFYAMEA